MCSALESFWLQLINVLVGMWNQFVFVPWTLCNRSRCTIWCLCCNMWLCWLALILVAILVIFFWLVMAIVVSVITLICELLCILGSIGPDRNPGCFGGGGRTTPAGPPPAPDFPTPTPPPSPPTA